MYYGVTSDKLDMDVESEEVVSVHPALFYYVQFNLIVLRKIKI